MERTEAPNLQPNSAWEGSGQAQLQPCFEQMQLMSRILFSLGFSRVWWVQNSQASTSMEVPSKFIKSHIPLAWGDCCPKLLLYLDWSPKALQIPFVSDRECKDFLFSQQRWSKFLYKPLHLNIQAGFLPTSLPVPSQASLSCTPETLGKPEVFRMWRKGWAAE